MRARVLFVAAAAALGAAYLFRDAGGSGAAARSPEPSRAAIPAPEVVPPVAPPIGPLRNVFEYSDAVSAAAPMADPTAPSPAAVTEGVEPPATEPSPLVRLIGLVRRGGQTRAALAVAGETVVLAAGESAGGFMVASIDEEEGVRLRAPDGTIIVLPHAIE